MKIQNIEIPHGLFLAPLAGVSDRTFRRFSRRFGAEYTVSEMVSAKALCYEQLTKKASALSRTAPLSFARKPPCRSSSSARILS